MDNFLINYSYSPLFEILSKVKNLFTIIDSHLIEPLKEEFEGKLGKTYIFQSSESAKSMESVEKISAWLLENGANRDAFILGVGGGITTDLTGFIASIYKRGVKFGIVPTTLTAQIDASIGGKTGVNFYGTKNILGTFATPEFIYINPSVLSTLSRREILSGGAELLKGGIISDASLFYQCAESLKKGGIPTLEMIKRGVEIKSEIVSKDRYEASERAKLNLGHTFGHAIEGCCQHFAPGQDICTHGEAVAAGILIAAEFSRKKGLLDSGSYRTIFETIRECHFRTIEEIFQEITDVAWSNFKEKLFHFIASDKKCKEDFINFVLIKGVGDVCIEPTSLTIIEEFINDLRNNQ